MSQRFTEESPEGVTDEGVAELGEVLAKRLAASPPIKVGAALRGTNRRTHLLATDAAGNRFTVKIVTHPNPGTPGRPFPTENVDIAGRLSRVLEAPTMLRTAMVGRIPGLGALSDGDAVARQWHGEPLDALSQPIRDELRDRPEEFLRQYGEWTAFGLLFCLCDGKSDHWTWQASDSSLGRADLECLFHLPGKPSDFRPGLQQLGLAASVAEAASAAQNTLAVGISAMLQKFAERRPTVDAVLGEYPHARDFLSTAPWIATGPEEMTREVAAALR